MSTRQENDVNPADVFFALTAAAPEMLEALEAAQTYIRSMQPAWANAEDLPPVMHAIDSAIRKAKGESQ